MKYKIGDVFVFKGELVSINKKTMAPYTLNSPLGYANCSEAVLDDFRAMECADCAFKGNINNKCAFCIRNKLMSDNYEWK